MLKSTETKLHKLPSFNHISVLIDFYTFLTMFMIWRVNVGDLQITILQITPHERGDPNRCLLSQTPFNMHQIVNVK